MTMQKVIVFKNLDGSCGIIIPSVAMFDSKSRDRENLRNLGIDFKENEEILNWIANKDVPPGLKWRITDITNIPSDRIYRGAWTDSKRTKTVDVDIDKAKEIHKNIFRKLRKPILEKLDIEYQQAVESNNKTKKKEIADKKQFLRDITNIVLPDNLEELKNHIPKELNSINLNFALSDGNNLDGQS